MKFSSLSVSIIIVSVIRTDMRVRTAWKQEEEQNVISLTIQMEIISNELFCIMKLSPSFKFFFLHRVSLHTCKIGFQEFYSIWNAQAWICIRGVSKKISRGGGLKFFLYERENLGGWLANWKKIPKPLPPWIRPWFICAYDRNFSVNSYRGWVIWNVIEGLENLMK